MYCRWMDQILGKGNEKSQFLKNIKNSHQNMKYICINTILFDILFLLRLLGDWACLKGHIAIY